MIQRATDADEGNGPSGEIGESGGGESGDGGQIEGIATPEEIEAGRDTRRWVGKEIIPVGGGREKGDGKARSQRESAGGIGIGETGRGGGEIGK